MLLLYHWHVLGILSAPHGRSKSGLYSVQYSIRIILIAAHAIGPHRQSKHFSESHGKGTRRPNLEVYNPLFGWLNHFISHKRRTPRAPTRSFSKIQRHQYQTQYNQMCVFPSESTHFGPYCEPRRHPSWGHFELQCLMGQVAHPSFLFLTKNLTSALIFSTFRQNNPTKLTCITLFKKKYFDMQRVHEATRLHLHAAQLRCNASYNSKMHGPVTMFGNIALDFLKNWVPNIHPRGNVHTRLYGVLTQWPLKSKTRRTKKSPLLIVTV